MDERVPVVIVGGSLVGLTASVLLGHHGVPHILVERHSGTAIHPRAASFHQRTLEIYRSVGLQDEIERAAAEEFEQDGAIIAVDSLGGRELASFYRSFNEGVEDLSPARRLFITQVGLEPVLRERAIALGADIRFSTELSDFSQDAGGVEAMLRSRDGERETRVQAQYLIGADGAHSPIRSKLGIPMEGRGDITDCATIYFKSDIRSLLRGRNLSVVYVNQPQLLAFFRFSITGDAGFLAVFAAFDKDGKRSRLRGEDIAEDRCSALVREALGVSEDFPVEIEDVQRWTASAASAASYHHGNIFLAGDAAHTMPPTGGFGGNTGIADVHNLAWKLAMVLDGRAGPALLDSYDAERRPVSQMTVEQAYRRYVERVEPSLPSADLPPSIADTAIELGTVYRSDAILGDGKAVELTEAPETASGRPGTRLAHAWLEMEGNQVSSLDLVGKSFSLFAGPEGTDWIEAARETESLEPHQIPTLEAARSLTIPEHGAMLVRPDGVIGWRSEDMADDPGASLSTALSRLAALQ